MAKRKKQKAVVEAYKKVRKTWTRSPRTKVKESAKLYKRKGRQRDNLH